ncbi:MAG: glycosyltransferase, partial [Candidatus Omnitrophota bacterium]
IPSGVDMEKFKPIEVNKDSSKIIFSWIGTMHRKTDIENIKFVIECFLELRRKYENIFLEIAGDGIYFSDLKAILEEIGDNNISLKGWINPDNMPDYLSSIDIGLVPLIQKTKFNFAKSPVKLFEYMAMAKSIVCSDIGECSHIIRDGENGFLGRNREDFIKKMEILIKDKKLREDLGRNSRMEVEGKFSLGEIGKDLFKILSKL